MNKIILANLKSNKSFESSKEWIENLLQNVDDSTLSKLDVSVVPSFTTLEMMSSKILQAQKNISVSVQDISSFPAGSYTGAISGQNLMGLNVKYAIVGHSERRKYFKETSNDVASKVAQCLENDIKPVVCIDTEYLEEQLNLIEKQDMEKCIVAYEPLSAIGSGKNADVGNVKSVVERVKIIAGDVPVIYGGSVNEFNISEYLMVCDGALIGRAALDQEQFRRVIESCI